MLSANIAFGNRVRIGTAAHDWNGMPAKFGRAITSTGEKKALLAYESHDLVIDPADD